MVRVNVYVQFWPTPGTLGEEETGKQVFLPYTVITVAEEKPQIAGMDLLWWSSDIYVLSDEEEAFYSESVSHCPKVAAGTKYRSLTK